MFQNVQPVPTVFLGLLACLLGWSLARGVNSVRTGNAGWLVYSVGYVIFLAAVLFLGFGTDSLTPPQTSLETWTVVGILFAITFALNLVAVPLLQRRYSPLFVRFMSYSAVLVFLSGFMTWMVFSTAATPAARAGGMLLPVILCVLGVLVGGLGMYKWLRGEI